MNYLITGASGFVGTALVDRLLASEQSVNYLGRKRGQNLDTRAAYFCWSGADEPPLNCMGRLDAVIHLAGEPVAQRWTRDVKQRIYESRIIGTRQLVNAIGKLKYKPSVLVSASAVGYYGDRGSEALTEESAPGSGFLADLCVEWEKEATAAREFGLRVVPVRIAIVLGAGGALKRMAAPFRFGLGGKLGSGKQWMPWIHIQDLIRMLVFAATESQIAGPLNGSSPNPITNAEFTRELARVLHRPAFLTVPRWALRIAAGEIADDLVASARVLPQAALRSGFDFTYGTVDIALRDVLRPAEAPK